MSACEAEMCPNWTGQGCACEFLGMVTVIRPENVPYAEEIMRLQDENKRLRPVVEAAGALVDEWYYRPQEGSEAAESNQAHYERLEAAVLAAREPRTGEGT